MALTKYKLGDLIELVDERNFDNFFGADSVVGLGTKKEICEIKKAISEEVTIYDAWEQI